MIGVLAGDGVDSAGLDALRSAIEGAGANLFVIAAHGGTIPGSDGKPVPVTKALFTTQSVEYDALVVAGGPAAPSMGDDAEPANRLIEAFRHCKVLAAWGDGVQAIELAGIPLDAPGLVLAETATPRSAPGWSRPSAGTASGSGPPSRCDPGANWGDSTAPCAGTPPSWLGVYCRSRSASQRASCTAKPESSLLK